MWTPKRALLLVGGFIVAVAAYFVYATFLGYVDGLPPLPQAYLAGDDGGEVLPLSFDKVYPVDIKIIRAFGDDCPELRRTIKLEVNKNNLVMATDDFIVEDGRVKMTPFSIAIFDKDKKDGKLPEINTIRSDVAYLTFDQPVATLADIANRKIIAAELRRDPDGRQQGQDAGGVRLVNNRRTLQRDDDLTLFTPGPVFYQEKQGSEPDKEPHIWTAEAVRLRDEQTKPSPTEVVAIGMDVYLTAEEPAKKKEQRGPPPAASSKPIGISGVKSIRLRSDVDMYLWIDSQAGFLSDSGKKAKPAEANAEPPAKAQLQIKTQGPFFYNVLTDQARFDISQHPGPYPNNVVVRRTHVPDTACDQLICDHLEIQFQRKSAPRDADGGKTGAVNLEIQTAHGWGNQVTLTSDLEGLTAFGNDLTYNAVTRETLLKGSPEMVVMKDGNEIYARELLTHTNEDGTQTARAKGPGHLRIFDRATDQRTLRARWNDTLVSSKDGALDVLTLTGDAVFEDQLHGQLLQADRLKVWLLPAEPVPAGQEKGEGQKRRPHQLEAIGNVLAKSADMNVHDTDRLVVWFKDGPSTDAPSSIQTAKPATDAAADTAAPADRPGADPAAPPATINPANPPTAPPSAATTPAPNTPPAKPKRPIDLSARSVVAHVVRVGPKNELEKLWCEGTVRVQQAPETPEGKGTDIHGQTLELRSYPEGHVLTVTGDPAEVQLDKLTISGPEVNIDQKENKTTVRGDGFMKMPSQTSFQGGALKEPTLLTIYWNREMFFDGLYASFYGGVQAEQLEAKLTCQNMQVRLDRLVSLKEGQKNDAPAKVRDLVCDQSVRIQDSTFQDQKLIRFSQIDAPTMAVDNYDGLVTASGPGVVRILQPGTKTDPANQPANAPANRPASTPVSRPANAPATPKPDELKLTRINYQGRMLANNNTRTAVFYENVELIHVPTENPNLAVDLDKLPEGAFYMRCDLLNVYQRRESAEKTYQQMEARGRSLVQAREFWGRADIIKFDESKDLVIFEAAEGNLATLYRQRARGTAPEEVKGKKIYYWRRTNDFKIEGGTRLEAN